MSGPGRRRHPVAGFALLQAVLALGFFSPALVTQALALPADLLRGAYPWGAYFAVHENTRKELSDLVLQFYPWLGYWAESVRAGQWPLWNPYVGAGLPFAANPLTAAYFPLTALSLLPAWLGWNLLLCARLWLAGLTAFLWLRGLSRSWWGAALGAIGYSFSMPFLAWVGVSHANVTALLPVLLLAALRLGQGSGLAWAAGFGAVLALQHLGGHPETTFLQAGAACVVWALAARRLTPRLRARSAGLLLLGGLAGTLAAAIQLLPFLDYLGKSRVLLEPGHLSGTLAVSHALTWLVPQAFGGGLETGFCGASVMALAATSLVLGHRRRLVPHLVLAVLSAGLAYGIPPVSLLSRLPPLDRTLTQRAIHITALAVATLAAFGFDRWRAAARRRKAVPGVWLVAATLVATAIAGLYLSGAPDRGIQAATLAVLVLLPLLLVRKMPRSGALTAVAAAVVLFDLNRAVFSFHGIAAPETLFFKTGLTSFLRSDAEPHRVLPMDRLLPPNLQMPYHVESLLSYDAIDLLDQARFFRRLGGYAASGYYSLVEHARLRNPRVAELLALKYLLDDPQHERLDTPAYEELTGMALTLAYDGPDGRAYRLRTFRPRLWLAGAAVGDPGQRLFYRALDAGDPQASSTLFVDAAVETASGGGRATEVRRAPGRIEVRTEAPDGAWLFLSEMFDGGGRTRVDGEAAAVRRANGIFRAVRVPRGTHDVSVFYRPASFVLGAVLSAAGLAALLALAVLARRREPRRYNREP